MFGNAYQSGHYLQVWDSKVNPDKNTAYKQLCRSQGSSVRRDYDKQVKSYLYDISGQTARLLLPAEDGKELALVQRYLVFQIYIPVGASWSLEIGLTDTGGIRRRVNLITGFGKQELKFFSLRYPIDTIPRGVWLFLGIDVYSFIVPFRSQVFRSVDHLALGSTCRLRRIFTLREWAELEVPQSYWIQGEKQQFHLIEYQPPSLSPISQSLKKPQRGINGLQTNISSSMLGKMASPPSMSLGKPIEDKLGRSIDNNQSLTPPPAPARSSLPAKPALTKMNIFQQQTYEQSIGSISQLQQKQPKLLPIIKSPPKKNNASRSDVLIQKSKMRLNTLKEKEREILSNVFPAMVMSVALGQQAYEEEYIRETASKASLDPSQPLQQSQQPYGTEKEQPMSSDLNKLTKPSNKNGSPFRKAPYLFKDQSSLIKQIAPLQSKQQYHQNQSPLPNPSASKNSLIRSPLQLSPNRQPINTQTSKNGVPETINGSVNNLNRLPSLQSLSNANLKNKNGPANSNIILNTYVDSKIKVLTKNDRSTNKEPISVQVSASHHEAVNEQPDFQSSQSLIPMDTPPSSIRKGQKSYNEGNLLEELKETIVDRNLQDELGSVNESIKKDETLKTEDFGDSMGRLGVSSLMDNHCVPQQQINRNYEQSPQKLSGIPQAHVLSILPTEVPAAANPTTSTRILSSLNTPVYPIGSPQQGNAIQQNQIPMTPPSQQYSHGINMNNDLPNIDALSSIEMANQNTPVGTPFDDSQGLTNRRQQWDKQHLSNRHSKYNHHLSDTHKNQTLVDASQNNADNAVKPTNAQINPRPPSPSQDPSGQKQQLSLIYDQMAGLYYDPTTNTYYNLKDTTDAQITEELSTAQQ